jgi:hypothetical protein
MLFWKQIAHPSHFPYYFLALVGQHGALRLHRGFVNKKTPKMMLSPQCITLQNNPILKNPRHQNKKYEKKNIFFFHCEKKNFICVFALHFGNAFKKI